MSEDASSEMNRAAIPPKRDSLRVRKSALETMDGFLDCDVANSHCAGK